MKTRYNIHAAIEFRSEGFEDYMGNPVPVDFKNSVNLACDERVMWGWDMPNDLIMQIKHIRENGEIVDRKKYNELRRSYRDWLKLVNDENN